MNIFIPITSSGQWSNQYNRIIDRFSHTIAAQFFGHTHFDEFEIFYSRVDPKKAINIGYLGPSITQHKGINPAYRIYTADGKWETPLGLFHCKPHILLGNYPESTHLILDHATFYSDITEANRDGRMSLRPGYEAKRDIGLESLQPQQWDDYVKTLAVSDKAFKLFQDHYTRLAISSNNIQ